VADGPDFKEGQAGVSGPLILPTAGPASRADVTGGLGTPLAYPASVDAAGLVVAPPLAGFSFAVVVLILQEPAAFRWPDAALALLIAAGLALVLATQFALATKRLAVTPEQWLAFRELSDSEKKSDYDEAMLADFAKATPTREATRLAHNLGLALFFAGVAVSLVPHGDASVWRAVAIGLAALACLAELVWVAEIIRIARAAQVNLGGAIKTALVSNFKPPDASGHPPPRE
jgi:hypothetical protein